MKRALTIAGSDAGIVKAVAEAVREFRIPKRSESMCTHGSGCTFASAITAGLAKGLTPPDAVKRAKDYVTEAIRKGFSTGSGHGPTNHLAGVSSKW